MISLFWSKIFRCRTHNRFKKVFDKLEAVGFALYTRADDDDPLTPLRVRNYTKNVKKVTLLYDKFIGKV